MTWDLSTPATWSQDGGVPCQLEPLAPRPACSCCHQRRMVRPQLEMCPNTQNPTSSASETEPPIQGPRQLLGPLPGITGISNGQALHSIKHLAHELQLLLGTGITLDREGHTHLWPDPKQVPYPDHLQLPIIIQQLPPTGSSTMASGTVATSTPGRAPLHSDTRDYPLESTQSSWVGVGNTAGPTKVEHSSRGPAGGCSSRSPAQPGQQRLPS